MKEKKINFYAASRELKLHLRHEMAEEFYSHIVQSSPFAKKQVKTFEK